MKIPRPRSKQTPASDFSFHMEENGHGFLALNGHVDVSTTGTLMKSVLPLVRKKQLSSLTVDLQGTLSFDDYGVLLLEELRRALPERNGSLTLMNLNDKMESMFRITGFFLEQGSAHPQRNQSSPSLVKLGDNTLRLLQDFQNMVTFVGDVCLSFFRVLVNPSRLRWEDTLLYMKRVGVDALPIVALISFLLGLIMAFMSSVQLQQFGANIYVASLVGLAMTRELGPIMTAIIVAGRSGSAFASEIGSMKISEEVDALTTMGFNTTIFLVMPKMIAAIIVMPILTLFSDLFAILGGLVVGITMLDITASAYLAQTAETLSLFDLNWGFLKSVVFALLITWVGCQRGFQTKGGADSVGQATTSSVVTSIFLIIFFDSLFAVIHRYWG